MPTSTRRTRLSIALSFLLAACGGGEPEAAASERSSGAEAPQSSEALSHHMRANFRLAIDARDALVDGKLQDAQAKAAELAALDYAGILPASWQGGAASMQAAARAITEAKDLNEAALHMAQLASTCGSCHAQLQSAEPDQAEHATFAADAEDITTRMARHQLAADNMWFGLSMPSEASWQEGARLLHEAPEDIPNIEGEPADPSLGAQMEIIREMGARALAAAPGTTERIHVYGELLGKCASCHAP